MAQLARRAGRRAADTAQRVDEKRSRAQDEAGERVQDAPGVGDLRDLVAGGSVTSELKETVREAAIEVLKPVMRKATTSAAKYAVMNGPGLVMTRIVPRVQEAGGAGAIAKGLTSKGGGIAESIGAVAAGIGGKLGGRKKEGESPSGTGRGRRLPVQEFIDVGVDLETAYDQFTQFEDWPSFMHRVERIEQRDDSTLMWHENIWRIRRSWEAEITDQTPHERIVWRSRGGPRTVGVVTFHRLSDNLTRILVTLDFQPKGLFEKTASGTRISRRALTSDLMRFKAFTELRDGAGGGWHGRIEDGEVVDEERDEAAPEDDESDEPAASEEEDEFEDEEEEPASAEDEGDEEPEEVPRPRQRARRAAGRRKAAASSDRGGR